MDAYGADRIAHNVSENGVLVFRRLDRLARFRIQRGQHDPAMKRQRKSGREKETDRDHVGRVVVEVQVLITNVRHPIEMTHNAVGKAVAPSAEQQRPDDNKRGIGKDCDAERGRHMQTDTEFAADFHFTQRPRDKRTERANRDQLPEAALRQRRER